MGNEASAEAAAGQRTRAVVTPSSCREREVSVVKVVVVGARAVGKSSLITRTVHKVYSEQYQAGTRIGLSMFTFAHSPQLDIQLHIWEVPGALAESGMTRLYYEGALGAVVVFDVANAESLRQAERWKMDLDKARQGDTRLPTVLLANKGDLKSRALGEDMTVWCRQHGFDAWFETSAKQNYGLREALLMLVTKILEM